MHECFSCSSAGCDEGVIKKKMSELTFVEKGYADIRIGNAVACEILVYKATDGRTYKPGDSLARMRPEVYSERERYVLILDEHIERYEKRRDFKR